MRKEDAIQNNLIDFKVKFDVTAKSNNMNMGSQQGAHEGVLAFMKEQ